jgi:hypothetical protein
MRLTDKTQKKKFTATLLSAHRPVLSGERHSSESGSGIGSRHHGHDYGARTHVAGIYDPTYHALLAEVFLVLLVHGTSDD